MSPEATSNTTASAISAITSTPGDFKFGGGAMNFSGDRDYIAIPPKTFSSGAAYTFAFWA